MTELTLTGMGLIYSILALVLGVALVIYGMKFWYLKVSKQKQIALKQKFSDEDTHLPKGLKSRNKHKDLDVFAISKPIWMYGLGTAMLFTLFAFSWEQKDAMVYIPDGAFDPIDEEVMIRTKPPAPPKPPPPPPPLPVEIIEVTEDMVEDQPKFESMEVDETTDVSDYEPVVDDTPAPPPPPPPPPIENDVPDIWNRVEEMPRFPGCEDFEGTSEEKYLCAQQKMLEYIYSKVKYPSLAKEVGVEGRAILQFVILENGDISDVNIVRDIGAGCGDAAKVVVKDMPRWNPGRQGKDFVKVRYTLPIVFKLKD